MYLLTKIKGWTQQGPMGNNKQIDPVTAAIVSAGVSAGGALIKRHQTGKMADKKEQAAKRMNKLAGRVSPEQKAQLDRMRKTASSGIDTHGAVSKIATPLYQQGEAQEAQAMGKITQQGLEGTIVAQEVSRKIGSDVRADIAGQARKIALENERAKDEAARNLQAATFKRSALLTDLAKKRELIGHQSDIGREERNRQLASSMYDIGTTFAFQGMKKSGETGFDAADPRNWYSDTDADADDIVIQ